MVYIVFSNGKKAWMCRNGNEIWFVDSSGLAEDGIITREIPVSNIRKWE